MARLGCGDHRVVIQARGGSPVLAELPWSRLTYGRRLDEVSSATVTVLADAAVGDACCGVLSTLTPWEHELAIWRDDEETWAGVIGEPLYEQMGVTIPSRDLFEWFERRVLPYDRSYTDADLGVIAAQYVADALDRDDSPNITVSSRNSGVTGSRSVLASAYRYAADELLDLARVGVDFTTIGRTLYIGGAEVPAADIGPFTNETLDEARIHPRGLIAASEVTVVGARRDDSQEPIVGVVGGAGGRLGLVQVVFDESSIEDDDSCRSAAQTRFDFLRDVPEYVDGILTPDAPVAMAGLIPGARAALAVTAACREAVGIWRLGTIEVTVDAAGAGGVSETVRATFEPLGTAA